MTQQRKEWTIWSGAALTLLTLAIVTFGWSVPALRTAATAASGERIEVSFIDAPRWMTPADLAPIQDLCAREAGSSAYDRAGLERAQSALMNSGWFKAVSQVRRVGSTNIEVVAQFAQPCALVADAAGLHLIDSDGRLLPRTYATGNGPNLPRIIGASMPRPTTAGSIWPGADLLAGLEMSKLVGTQRWRSQVSAIDVTDFATRKSMTLITSNGCRMHWGRAPGSEASAEVPAAQKLRYIDMLHNQTGRIDGQGSQEIDLSVDYVGGR